MFKTSSDDKIKFDKYYVPIAMSSSANADAGSAAPNAVILDSGVLTEVRNWKQVPIAAWLDIHEAVENGSIGNAPFDNTTCKRQFNQDSCNFKE